MNDPTILSADPRRHTHSTPGRQYRWPCWKRQGAVGKGLPCPVTCIVKDTLFCVEGHWDVTGVGDFDDVGSGVTKDEVAKVQDILWQLDSEMVNKLPLPVAFPKVRGCEALFYLLCTMLCSGVENNERLPEWR